MPRATAAHATSCHCHPLDPCLLGASQAIQDEFGPQWVNDRHVRRLAEMGFEEKAVRVALAAAGDKLDPALEQLQVWWEWV